MGTLFEIPFSTMMLIIPETLKLVQNKGKKTYTIGSKIRSMQELKRIAYANLYTFMIACKIFRNRGN